VGKKQKRQIIVGYDIKSIIPAPPGWKAIIVDEGDVVAQDEGAVGFATVDVPAFALLEHRFKDGSRSQIQTPEALVANGAGDLHPVMELWGEMVVGVVGPSCESRERLLYVESESKRNVRGAEREERHSVQGRL